MSSKKADHQYRKDIILGIVVDRYVGTITPVSSGYIAKSYRLDLSSATIRNILAELEEEGYLTHPHTSAGRVPTQFGYRYYVDNLMKEIKLLNDEKDRIRQEYHRQVGELEALLEATSHHLSKFTHYTSLISIDGQTEKLFCRGTSFVVGYPEQPDVERIQNILYTLEEKERIWQVLNRSIEKKIEIYIGNELECEGIEGCSLVVSRYQSSNGPSGRLAVLGPTRMDYSRVVSALDYFSDLMSEVI